MKSKNILAWALTFVLICLPLITFTSCGDYDYEPIAQESIIGTWTTTALKIDGKWVDVSKAANSDLSSNITFYANGTNKGTYRSWGSLGTGNGIWELSDNTITIYANNEVYITLKKLIINGKNVMSGTMVRGKSSTEFLGKKQ